MCLAVPVKVVESLGEGMVRCRIGESETYITASTALIEEDVRVDDYLIVHAGFAMRKLEREDAIDTLELLREMVLAAGESPI